MSYAVEKTDPLAVLVYRGETVESRHAVSFAIADAAGKILDAGGEIDRPVFPRSAIKMLQAIPLVETGAADRFGLSPEELALACASHGGEPRHVEAVAAWLERLGLSADDLECGAHPPSHAPSARALAGSGRAPTGLHNNCSGKHAGMLTLARHLGVATGGYIRPDHPVQQVIDAALEALTGVSPWPAPAIDGCGVPTYAVPLGNLVAAMARFASPGGLPPSRAAACRRLAKPMMQHPYMVAGDGRACTLIMQALPGVLVKTGAEGVYAAALPERGLGLALKVEDGASRASSVALIALLDRLGALDDSARQHLHPIARPLLKNHAGTTVGHIQAGAACTADL
ncbi:MAG: asparaginase [Alphaproteobacteria bacterium]